jgi:hypothetical protein
MFRPAFENLEKREVFSVAQPMVPADGADSVYVEEVSSGFQSQTRPMNDGVVAAGAGGIDALTLGPEVRGIGGDFNNDGSVDAADYVAVRAGTPDRVQPSPHDIAFQRMLLPYLEQDNVYNLTANLTGARQAAFTELGPRGILLDPAARGNLVDIVDGTSNTMMFAEVRTTLSRSCVTDLVIDPFDSNR